MRQATTDLVGRPSPPTKTFDGVLCFWPWLMSCLPTSTRAVGLPVRPRNDNDQRQAWLPNRRLPTAHSHSGPHREDNVRDLINHHTWSFSILHTWPHLILRSLNQSNQVDKKKKLIKSRASAISSSSPLSSGQCFVQICIWVVSIAQNI
jgi:hypothetical protein